MNSNRAALLDNEESADSKRRANRPQSGPCTQIKKTKMRLTEQDMIDNSYSFTYTLTKGGELSLSELSGILSSENSDRKASEPKSGGSQTDRPMYKADLPGSIKRPAHQVFKFGFHKQTKTDEASRKKLNRKISLKHAENPRETTVKDTFLGGSALENQAKDKDHEQVIISKKKEKKIFSLSQKIMEESKKRKEKEALSEIFKLEKFQRPRKKRQKTKRRKDAFTSKFEENKSKTRFKIRRAKPKQLSTEVLSYLGHQKHNTSIKIDTKRRAGHEASLYPCARRRAGDRELLSAKSKQSSAIKKYKAKRPYKRYFKTQENNIVSDNKARDAGLGSQFSLSNNRPVSSINSELSYPGRPVSKSRIRKLKKNGRKQADRARNLTLHFPGEFKITSLAQFLQEERTPQTRHKTNRNKRRRSKITNKSSNFRVTTRANQAGTSKTSKYSDSGMWSFLKISSIKTSKPRRKSKPGLGRGKLRMRRQKRLKSFQFNINQKPFHDHSSEESNYEPKPVESFGKANDAFEYFLKTKDFRKKNNKRRKKSKKEKVKILKSKSPRFKFVTSKFLKKHKENLKKSFANSKKKKFWIGRQLIH